VLVCSEIKVPVVVLREKYCWLMADKPNEQGEYFLSQYITSQTMYQATKQGATFSYYT
jgi:hypothetical protein